MVWIKRGILYAIGLAIIGAIVHGLMPKPVAVEIVGAQRQSIQITVDEEGMTRVRDRFTVTVPIGGTIERIALKPGDTITAGAKITVLRPVRPTMLDARQLTEARAAVWASEAGLQQAKAAVRAAFAEFDFAASEHARARQLLAKKHVSQGQVDAAATREEAARAALESARFGEQAAQFRLQMAKATLLTSNDETRVAELAITAPVDGKVLRVLREDEGTVRAGEALLEIGNPQALEVVVDLLSRDAVRVQQGAKVYIERWGGEEALQGTVRTVEPHGYTKISALGVEEQRVNIIIDFDGPNSAWQKLGDGYRVETRILVSETARVLTLPSSALFEDKGRQAVFVVESDKAVLRHVRVGANNGLHAEILDGIDADTRVITHPSDALSDGASISSR